MRGGSGIGPSLSRHCPHVPVSPQGERGVREWAGSGVEIAAERAESALGGRCPWPRAFAAVTGGLGGGLPEGARLGGPPCAARLPQETAPVRRSLRRPPALQRERTVPVLSARTGFCQFGLRHSRGTAGLGWCSERSSLFAGTGKVFRFLLIRSRHCFQHQFEEFTERNRLLRLPSSVPRTCIHSATGTQRGHEHLGQRGVCRSNEFRVGSE